MSRLLGSLIAVAAVASSGCIDCKSGGNALLCGAEGTPAPELKGCLADSDCGAGLVCTASQCVSPCQPRAVMPEFFKLIDAGDPSLKGLRDAVAVLGTPRCAGQPAFVCKTDDDCGSSISGSCSTANSPISDVLFITLRAMATIAADTAERDASGKLACLTAQAAQNLPPAQRNRTCELRRMLDILLLQNGGANLFNDPNVKRVLLALLDYVQGKTDGQTHYELFTGIGRMAASTTAACEPAQGWKLIDNLLAYLQPAVAGPQLTHLKTLLTDQYTKTFLGQLNYQGGQGRESWIVLIHALSGSIINAANGDAALNAIQPIINQVTQNAPKSFTDALNVVLADTRAMLGDATGIFPPLTYGANSKHPNGVLACVASAEVRCPDPTSCTNKDDELIGALYDLLSRPEQTVGGGLDLTTLIDALRSLVCINPPGQTGCIDGTGQISRTLRLIVQGIEGDPDPNAPHEARDAVAALTKDALTKDQAARLVPALSKLIQPCPAGQTTCESVVLELFSLLQDLLYTCKPPHP